MCRSLTCIPTVHFAKRKQYKTIFSIGSTIVKTRGCFTKDVAVVMYLSTQCDILIRQRRIKYNCYQSKVIRKQIGYRERQTICATCCEITKKQNNKMAEYVYDTFVITKKKLQIIIYVKSTNAKFILLKFS